MDTTNSQIKDTEVNLPWLEDSLAIMAIVTQGKAQKEQAIVNRIQNQAIMGDTKMVQ